MRLVVYNSLQIYLFGFSILYSPKESCEINHIVQALCGIITNVLAWIPLGLDNSRVDTEQSFIGVVVIVKS